MSNAWILYILNINLHIKKMNETFYWIIRPLLMFVREELVSGYIPNGRIMSQFRREKKTYFSFFIFMVVQNYDKPFPFFLVKKMEEGCLSFSLLRPYPTSDLE